MLDHLLFVYEFNLKHIRYLVEDLTPEQCVHQPSGLINHPAWQVGHLALAANIAAFEMGAEQTIPPEWAERFFPGMTEAQLSADKSAWETQDNTESGAVLSAFNCDVGGLTPWDTSSCQWGVVNSESKVAEDEGKFLDGYRSRDLGSGHKELRHSVTDDSIDM